MEYIEGKPLCGPLPLEDATRIALQIASALEAAHEKRILHRDLKPANILVSRSGVKLLDFGLAKIISAGAGNSVMQTSEAGTMEGTILGTAAYMSPEQAQAKPLDERSDIFGYFRDGLFSGRRAPG